MKTKEQQVEELEEWYSVETNKSRIKKIIQKAKLLKAEIEKGCGKKYKRDKRKRYGGYWDYCNKSKLCPTCKNLIERLNKIIGEESKERSEE